MHQEILLPQTKALLEKLKSDNLPLGTYLAGETAIALYLGHRRSADLDFFTPSTFAEEQWEQKLSQEIEFSSIQRDWQTLVGTAGEAKFSLFGYKYKLIGEKEQIYGIKMASLKDLAAMKLNTILGRGTKRGLIDIYFLTKEFPISQMFVFYDQKYGDFDQKEFMIRKALTYFEEADGDEMPEMLIPTSWEEVKNKLQNLGIK
jgi:hypothetical protein